MSLPSPCTVEDAEQEFDRCIDFRSDSSGVLARDLLAAIDWLLVRRPSGARVSQRADTRFEATYDPGNLRALKDDVQAWLGDLGTTAEAEAATIISRSNLPRQFSLQYSRGY